MAESPSLERKGKEAPSPERVSAPSITLPKGGGAVRGIGEKMSFAAATGTVSFSIPINLSPGRSGAPSISLSYDSGAGAGPFGLGWSLALPSITRKTEKRLPLYLDTAEGEDSDTFILSGAEDLVPVLIKKADRWTPEVFRKKTPEGSFAVKRYRPRVEALFARIEKWTHLETGRIHWRVTDKNNTVNLYGMSPEACASDHEETSSRIFKWMLEKTFDDKGNVTLYEYKRENGENVDFSRAEESGRAGGGFSQIYLKKVRYGNRVPFEEGGWLFEAVFDYGDHDAENPEIEPDRAWPARRDPFSVYNPGFEIRTYRLCRRVLMFHRFPSLGPAPCLVRSTDFTYDESSSLTFLASARETGWLRKGTSYRKKSLPPLEFAYSKAKADLEPRTLETGSLENFSWGTDGAVRWEDLYREGIPGVIEERAEAWFYKRNHGNGRLGPAELAAEKPAGAALEAGRVLTDVGGAGAQYLKEESGTLSGFWKLGAEEKWAAFTAFEQNAAEALDPSGKLPLDLDGDGLPELLMDEDTVYSWYPALGEKGRGAKESTPKSADEARRPVLVHKGASEAVLAADMSGGGLQDIVRIRNGEVSYWPNLGWGRFGRRITMSGAPWFDAPDQFDPSRVRLADIDGSGLADILYLGREEIVYWINQSGNSWSEGGRFASFPRAHNLNSVSALDLLGNGTSCLVWSSALASDAAAPVRYLDLCGGKKPHLLESVKNNYGSETYFHYAPSTKFYLADREAGRPWTTRLAFPVHVLERLEIVDRVSRTRFVSRYAYHHGFYDEAEREFRGFGLVEQRDTEEFAALSKEGALQDAENLGAASHVPPVLTKTWHHTGAFHEAGRISKQFESEYFADDGAPFFEDSILPEGLTAGELREAARALRGSVLRQEIYAEDGKEESARPYRVSESNFTVKCLQPRAGNKHAVFMMHSRESADFYYERKLFSSGGKMLPDPRATHALTLAVDDYGNVLRTAAIAYGRRFLAADALLTAADKNEQKKLLISYTENSFTNAVLEEDAFRAPLACENKTYEILNAEPFETRPQAANFFRFAEIAALFESLSGGANDIPSEDAAGETAGPGVPARRLLKMSRTLFRKDDFTGPLEHGRLEPLAIPYESYSLAFTPGLLSKIFEGRITPAMLEEGGYKKLGGHPGWWVPGGRMFFSPQSAFSPAAEKAHARGHFFKPCRFQDAFGQTTRVRYDDFDLLLLETEDPLANKTTAGERKAGGGIENKNDYRVLQPFFMTDPNGNRSAVVYDILGLAAGTAVMGKAGEEKGDSFEGFEPDLDDAVTEAFLENPFAGREALLKKASSRIVYDPFAFHRTQDTPQPQGIRAVTLSRETHAADLKAGKKTRIFANVTYSDGTGRDIQKKTETEPGADGKPRWITSGWTILNNKGDPVKQYEPFFSATHLFEFARKEGVSPTLFYDALGRNTATLEQNHAWVKTVFDPWRQETWDPQDTVLIHDPKNDPEAGEFFRRLPEEEYLPGWHAARSGGALGAEEKEAAEKAAAHAATPAVQFPDSLGRIFLAIADNGASGKFRVRTVLDIEGKTLKTIDAKGRTAELYDYDLLGNRVREAYLDKSARCILNDVSGNPLRNWDSRGRAVRMVYDELRRPKETYFRGENGPEKLVQKAVYGESKGDALNHRTRLFQTFDTAGTLTNEAYDFKGNLLSSARRFAKDYKEIPDWSQSVSLETEIFTSRTAYDALNRPAEIRTPDASVIRPELNESGGVQSLGVRIKGASGETQIIKRASYDAKGRRARIEYGNGVKTNWEYDPQTFRLRRVRTLRGADALQDLSYHYDAKANVTAVRDSAKQTVYFNGAAAPARGDYIYDALYRLIEARGREHAGQAGQPENSWDNKFRRNLPHPEDGGAMRPYTEQYRYDDAGNILERVHRAPGGNWTREYFYEETGLINAAEQNNRLTRTRTGTRAENYSYDAHGNITAMPHLSFAAWNHRDELSAVSSQAVNGGSPETTYYIYDSGGKRVRKVTERTAPDGQAARKKSERIYADGFEVYREYEAGETVRLERETLRIADGERTIAILETKTKDLQAAGAQGGMTAIRYQIDNHLGSSCLELDDAGAVISYEEYDPYGGTTYRAGRSAAEVSMKRYAYTGKERDEESGFYYHGARYYMPWLARWLSPDPAGAVDGSNLYQYVNANPVKRIDSSGTQEHAPPAPPILARVKGSDEEGNPLIEVSTSYISLPSPKPKREKRHEGGHKTESLWDIPAYWMLYEINSAPGKSSDNFVSDKDLKTAQDTAAGVAIVAGSIATGGILAEFGVVSLGLTTTGAEVLAGAGSGYFTVTATSAYEGRDPTPEEMAIEVGGGAALGGLTVPLARFVPKIWTSMVDDVPVPAPSLELAPGMPASGAPQWQPFTVPRSPDLSVNTGSPASRWHNCSFNVCAVLTNEGKTSTQISLEAGLPEAEAFPEQILKNLGVPSSPTYSPPGYAELVKNLKTYPAGTNVGIYYTNPGGQSAHSIMAMVGKNGDVLFVDPQMVPMQVVQGPPPGATDIKYYVPQPKPR